VSVGGSLLACHIFMKEGSIGDIRDRNLVKLFTFFIRKWHIDSVYSRYIVKYALAFRVSWYV
jgi:hypothetical protein